MDEKSVIYLCINLPRAEERRLDIVAQAQKLGLDIQFVEAVAGKDLPAEVPEYDRAERHKRYHYDLTPNEIACTLSHKKALRTFLDSTADYAVIIEDDVFFADNIKQGIHELTHHLQGWEAAKLYIAEGDRLYSLGDEGTEGSCVRAVFPKKMMWASVAWLYTRAGARKLLDGLRSFHLATDQQIGTIIMQQRIPVIAATPTLIGTYDPNSENSSIGLRGSKLANGRRRTLLQYLRYRLSVMQISRAKKKMINLMKNLIYRK